MTDTERERYETTIRTLSTARTLERVLLTLIFIVSIGLSFVVFWQNQTFQNDSAARSAERNQQLKALDDNQDELKAYIKCVAIQATGQSLGDITELDKCAAGFKVAE